MIVSRRLDVARILRPVGRPIAVLLACGIAVTALRVAGGRRWAGVDDLPLSLLGSALAIILGLRNNAAYARWRERARFGEARSTTPAPLRAGRLRCRGTARSALYAGRPWCASESQAEPGRPLAEADRAGRSASCMTWAR